MSESHSGFWVDWQFPVDKQVLEKFVVVCSDCLSFRKNRTTTFDVAKELRCLPVNYIPEIPFAYVKVIPIAMQSKFQIHKTLKCIVLMSDHLKVPSHKRITKIHIKIQYNITKKFKPILCLIILRLGNLGKRVELRYLKSDGLELSLFFRVKTMILIHYCIS